MTTTKNNHIVQPYLFFDGRCEEALEFYRQALDAEVTALMRFKDSPDQSMSMPGIDGNKVMHANFSIGETQVMASDGRCTGQPRFQGFALSLTVPTEAEAERRFAALAKSGEVSDAVDQDLLFTALWNGCRPLWRIMDDHRGDGRNKTELSKGDDNEIHGDCKGG